MAGRPRVPTAVAKATGAAAKNPKRFKDRAAPKVAPIGQAPSYFDEDEREAWNFFATELPWLGASDRTILEMAARIRARMKEGMISMAAMTELRQILNALGATPAARSKVAGAPNEDEDEDPAAEFIQ